MRFISLLSLHNEKQLVYLQPVLDNNGDESYI